MPETPQTDNLGLYVWRDVSAYFNHAELAANWDGLDAHDHSPGKGTQIGTTSIAPRAIVNQHIASGAIQENVIADRAIKTQKIDYGAVHSENIGEGHVTSTKLGQFSGARVYQANATPVRLPYNEPTPIPFNRVLWDGASSIVGLGTNARHWREDDPTFVRILETGIYMVTAHVVIAPSTVALDRGGTTIPINGGIREIRIVDEADHSYARASGWAPIDGSDWGYVSLTASTVFRFNAGKKLRVLAYQNQTITNPGTIETAPSVQQAMDYSPELAVQWIAPAPSLTS